MATVTKTIGTDGRDYSTIAAWAADLDEAAVYSAGDDAVGECYNDSVFEPTAEILIDGGGTIGLNSITLQPASGEGHDGTAGTGVRVYNSSGLGSSDAVITVTAPLQTTVQDIEIYGYEGLFANTACYGAKISSGSDSAFRRLIVHDADVYSNPNGITAYMAPNSDILDCIVYNIGQIAFYTRDAYKDGVNLLNNTAYNFDVYGEGHAGFDCEARNSSSLQNNVACEGGNSTTCFAVHANFTEDHNASSDATASGTGSLTSITVADQFVSTTDGSEDLHLTSGADCIDAGADLGTTPTGVEIDIDGRDRDAEGDTWDIGADEHVSAAPAAAMPFDAIYRHLLAGA